MLNFRASPTGIPLPPSPPRKGGYMTDTTVPSPVLPVDPLAPRKTAEAMMRGARPQLPVVRRGRAVSQIPQGGRRLPVVR